MNISKKIHPQGKSLLRLLKTLPESRLSAGQRHPASVYAISLSQTLRRIEDVLEQLPEYVLSVQLDTAHEADQALAATTETLIRQMDRHIGDCLGIIAASLGAESPEYRECWQGIRSFAEVRKLQADRLRDHGERVRLMSFTSSQVVVSGFFIEGRDAAQALGPSPVVHQGGNTAFSFNLYLRRIFLELNLLNTRLYDVLRRSGCKEVANDGASENNELVNVAGKIAALGLYVFPDELKSAFPNIFLKHEGGAGVAGVGVAGVDVAIVSMPSLKKPLLAPLPCSISISCDADAAGHDYRVPYS